MKQSILFAALLIYSTTFSQGLKNENGNLVKLDTLNIEYVKGEIIVKFKEGYLNSDFQSSSKTKLKVSEAFEKGRGKDFQNVFKDKEIRKLVTKFKPDIKQSTTRKGKVVQLPDFHNLMVLEIEEGEDVKAYCKAISKFDGVEYAEPNFLIQLTDTPPNDVNYAQQTGFEQANGHDIDANRAWDFATGNYNIKVAVIDNGIDYHNPDLGNGDFGFEGAKVRGGWDYINNDADPDYTEADIDSHGTECAGIIGAIRNNNQGVAGLAGGNGNNIGVQLFALKVGPVACQNGALRCLNTAKIIDAIIEASVWSPSFGYGCHVINNSYGSPNYSEAMRSAVRTAAQNNVVFVAAKGNNNTGNLNYPSDYDNNWVVSVGATDELDNRSVWLFGQASNFGNGIDVAAPGSRAGAFNVFTTTVPGNNTYRAFDGTSAAAPHVAGLAALILTEANEQGIQLHHEDVEWIINSSAEDVNAFNLPGYDDQMGHGRINAGRALEMMNAPWELTHQSAAGGTIVNTSGWYNMVFSNPGGGLASGVYSVRQHEVHRTVATPFYTGDHFVWGRGANETIGWSGASPNYQLGFCDVVATTNTTATLRTFVYEVRTILGQDLGWRPTTAANVNFAYTTLGTPCPPTRNIVENIVPGTRVSDVLYAASNTLTANNAIQTGSNIVYSAGNSVVLNSGFSAGANFRATIAGCINGNIGGRVGTESSVGLQPDTDLKKEDTFEEESIIAYPNPFSEVITIEYVLSKQGSVSIELFDLTGKSMAVLVDNDFKRAGLYHVNFGGDFIKPGVYVYKMQTNLGIKTGKIMKK